LAKRRPDWSRNLFAGQVKEIAYFGSYNTYIVVTPQGKRMKITEPNGSHLNCSTSPGKTRCFSGGTTPTRCCCAIDQDAMSMSLPTFKMPGRRFVIGVPFAWLVVFFLLPFLILLYISFVDMGNDISPFKPIWDSSTGLLHLKYENYWTIFRSAEEVQLFQTIYIEAYVRSMVYALATALLCLLIGYPFSYFIARSPASVRPALLMMVMLPFWTSFLLRVYAWKGILADQGVINQVLMGLGHHQ
jgi:ABC-type Fe3+ transport system permease subunit